MRQPSLRSTDTIGEIVADWDLGNAADPRLTDIHRLWQGWRGDRRVPSRADIDPARVPPRLLPFLCLVEVLDNLRDFRFRLGHAFPRIHRHRGDRRRIAEVFPPAFCREVHYHWNSCVERPHRSLAGAGYGSSGKAISGGKASCCRCRRTTTRSTCWSAASCSVSASLRLPTVARSAGAAG